jgi:DMSO reductase family type II enzyme heme b subunit
MPAFGDDLDSRAIWGLVMLLEELGREGSGIDVDAPGDQIYADRCAVCHGQAGAGDGPLAAELMPPPRNFVHGAYRLRSTEYGEAPIDSDIIGATAKGVGDTSMGRFLLLGSDRLDSLTKHVMSFDPKLFATTPKSLTGDPMPAGSTAQLAARGRVVYAEAKCSDCHGALGRGDGPQGLTLKDDEGHPSIPTDLTMRWKMKLGASANDVFRTLIAGLNGTPMKSYATTLSGDDRWALAHYLDRIARPRPRYAPTIHTALVTETIPLDPNDGFWKALLPATVSMAPQVEISPYWTEPAIDMVDVAVAANNDDLGIMLTWDDRSRESRTDEAPAPTVAAAVARHGTWKLSDAIALEFPEKSDPKGSLPPSFLGDAKHAVRRWYWSADREERGEATALVQTFTGPKSAGAASPGSPTVRVASAYADGQWRVVLIGKRPPKTVTTLPVALQAWDGGAGEAGNWQSLSAWMNINLH